MAITGVWMNPDRTVIAFQEDEDVITTHNTITGEISETDMLMGDWTSLYEETP